MGFGLSINVYVAPLLGIEFKIDKEEEKCGVQLDVVDDKDGEVVCGKRTWALQIPPIKSNSDADSKPLVFDAGPDDLKQAEAARDIACGLAEVLGFFLGTFCMCLSCACVASACSEESIESAFRVVILR